MVIDSRTIVISYADAIEANAILLLMKDQQRTVRRRTTQYKQQRVSIGTCADGDVSTTDRHISLIVTCDGRRENAVGMSIDDMREFMYNLGVQEAFNLDGGYSAVMVFMGTVINNPSYVRLKSDGSNMLGRPINDMLMLSEFDENGEIIPLSALQPDKFAPVETE